MRLLITIILLYFAYKLFVAPLIQGLKSPKNQDEIKPPSGKKKNDDYIDYEEVD
ncbi:MAG: hypothetical protein SFU99_05835 [Saprospiraceae bacterium]|nr:hypothetical protein [Saprospiraceae bacterium]